ncbi:hypothetical protein A3Q56_00974 [Intoshia linei]|uniref:Calponin-homology (CH) domain-containing protein n=1 Tax=Intoshia linei TaxID=1819745 RepID=A0A177BCM1_9BILA|nr:hypothetical protein A3Q56_00974 [Intoshia linei]
MNDSQLKCDQEFLSKMIIPITIFDENKKYSIVCDLKKRFEKDSHLIHKSFSNLKVLGIDVEKKKYVRRNLDNIRRSVDLSTIIEKRKNRTGTANYYKRNSFTSESIKFFADQNPKNKIDLNVDEISLAKLINTWEIKEKTNDDIREWIDEQNNLHFNEFKDVEINHKSNYLIVLLQQYFLKHDDINRKHSIIDDVIRDFKYEDYLNKKVISVRNPYHVKLPTKSNVNNKTKVLSLILQNQRLRQKNQQLTIIAKSMQKKLHNFNIQISHLDELYMKDDEQPIKNRKQHVDSNSKLQKIILQWYNHRKELANSSTIYNNILQQTINNNYLLKKIHNVQNNEIGNLYGDILSFVKSNRKDGSVKRSFSDSTNAFQKTAEISKKRQGSFKSKNNKTNSIVGVNICLNPLICIRDSQSNQREFDNVIQNFHDFINIEKPTTKSHKISNITVHNIKRCSQLAKEIYTINDEIYKIKKYFKTQKDCLDFNKCSFKEKETNNINTLNKECQKNIDLKISMRSNISKLKLQRRLCLSDSETDNISKSESMIVQKVSNYNHSHKRKEILNWCNDILEKYSIRMSTSYAVWFSGKELCLILHNFLPDKISVYQVYKNKPIDNMKLAILVAETEGIPKILVKY